MHYDEGAAVGYRWYDQKGFVPLFAFGYGLSYTTFTHETLSARIPGPLRDPIVEVSFTVHNTGARSGKDVVLVFVSPVQGGWEAPKRLGAFVKVELAPGSSERRDVLIDPRLFTVWDAAQHGLRIAAGSYKVTLAASARAEGPSVTVTLPEISPPHLSERTRP